MLACRQHCRALYCGMFEVQEPSLPRARPITGARESMGEGQRMRSAGLARLEKKRGRLRSRVRVLRFFSTPSCFLCGFN